MREYLLILILTAFFASCSVKSEPLILGEDACHTCKMTLVDGRFGGEIVTKKGKIYKFDDLSCMINFSKSEYESRENIALELVVDYAHPGNLVEVEKSFYCKSDKIRSPMAGNAAAFEKLDELEKVNAQWQGAVLNWNELLRQSE